MSALLQRHIATTGDTLRPAGCAHGACDGTSPYTCDAGGRRSAEAFRMTGFPPPPSEDAYARIAPWYDREHDAFEDDVQFYRDIAASAGPAVLEIGCGSGRVTLPLARMGSAVTGVDSSASMLALCRQRLDSEPARVQQRVTLVHADARDLGAGVPPSHALAILPLNTLAHFAAAADRLAVLRQVREHLVTGGRLVLDVDLEGPRRLLAQPGLLWMLGTWDLSRADQGTPDTEVQVIHFVSAAPGAEPDTAIVTHIFDVQRSDGRVRRAVSRMTLGILTRHELELTLEHAGFTLEATYGSYDLEPYVTGAERAICIAHS